MKVYSLLLSIFLPAIASAQCTFSPAAGTYASTQSVTVSCSGGLTAFYTTDGSTPSIAGTPYTSPITVSSSQTIKVIAAQVGVMVQNVGTSSSHWKCATHTATTYGSLSCQASGGVGSINPSNVVWNYGSPMTEATSTTSSTGSTQMLYINTQPSTACTTCTQLVQEKVLQVDKGSTFLLNNEMDSNINMLATYNQFHTASLQCNQQSGNPAGNGFPGGMQWQYDNQQGSWQNTGITFGCPLSTTQRTAIRYGMHWTNGDTSCSGFSCDSYDFLTVCVGVDTSGNGGTCHDFTINKTLPGYTEPTFSQSIVLQDQPDLTNTTTCGTSPCTATRSVWRDNATAAFYGTSVTSSATYNITGGVTAPTTLRGQAKFTGRVVIP